LLLLLLLLLLSVLAAALALVLFVVGATYSSCVAVPVQVAGDEETLPVRLSVTETLAV
jgi:hypothetical protein